MADDFAAKIPKTTKEWAWFFYQELGYRIVENDEQEEALKKAMDKVLAVYAETQRQHKQQLQEWVESFDDFLVQWLWNDYPTPKNIKWDEGEAFWTVNYYPSQDLDIILSFREKLEDLLSEGLEHG